MNHEIAYTRQAYKNTHFLTEHYCINFCSSACSSSDATFCTAWYNRLLVNRLLVVLYFIFIKNLLFLLQSVSWTAHQKYNTHSIATSNDFVAKIFLKVVLRTYSKDLIWDLFTIVFVYSSAFVKVWIGFDLSFSVRSQLPNEYDHLYFTNNGSTKSTKQPK